MCLKPPKSVIKMTKCKCICIFFSLFSSESHSGGNLPRNNNFGGNFIRNFRTIFFYQGFNPRDRKLTAFLRKVQFHQVINFKFKPKKILRRFAPSFLFPLPNLEGTEFYPVLKIEDRIFPCQNFNFPDRISPGS